MKTCKYCGREFKPARNKPHQKYCVGRECGVKAWREAHPGCEARWSKAQRDAYPERTRAAVNRYAAKHPEKARERAQKHYGSHKVEVNTRAQRWAKDHPVERHAAIAVRRALITGAAISNLAEIKEIYRRAKEDKKVRCYLCGKLVPMGHRHVDHIIPLSKGGAHRPSNLAVACAVCNLSKGIKNPEEVGILI